MSSERRLWPSTGIVRRLSAWLIAMPRYQKRLLLGAADLLCLSAALWLALSFRHGEIYLPDDVALAVVLGIAPVISIASFAWFGLYRLVTRYINQNGPTLIALCMALSVLIWALIVLLSGLTAVPRSVVVLYGLLGGGLTYALRLGAAWVLRRGGIPLPHTDILAPTMVIYGAGETGAQLAEALRQSKDAHVVGFLDNSPSLWGQYVGRLKIYRPRKLSHLIERVGVSEVVLAMPEAMRNERREILRWLQKHPVRVRILPAIEDFAAGRATVNDLRPVEVDDLLGRDPVPPNPTLLTKNIVRKSVMVTGAGGSIGSELARQIVRQRPHQIILFEQSETSLYEIEAELTELTLQMAVEGRPLVVQVLGSVLDEALLRDVIATYDISTVFHAAAYKHVPIVEANPAAGIRNNTLGTRVLARVASEMGVGRLVLISTDKAVRPSSVMGATKRVAELILQAYAANPANKTVFTMVRFGNVLDSSGSVVRLFKKQVQRGGPVTVTDPEMTRYFMSIREAAELVIQAGAMAEGGEVFVLDMGEPVKIMDLARSMITFMGHEVQEPGNPQGDIKIEICGLRPGEKIHEELLIGGDVRPTLHRRIMRSIEPSQPWRELEAKLAALEAACHANDTRAMKMLLANVVEGDGLAVERPVATVGGSSTTHATRDGDDRLLH
ncbi:MAG: polysaccharide biosynthesis protein [Hyphomicrobiaceae bacterium]|nr:polysaccharide biosynthesis protein [Hyphomicrobiaceae bacterium]